MSSVYAFWRELGKDPATDPLWAARQASARLLDEVYGPVLGPPLPPSILDRVLRGYAPALAAQINASRPILEWLRG